MSSLNYAWTCERTESLHREFILWFWLVVRFRRGYKQNTITPMNQISEQRRIKRIVKDKWQGTHFDMENKDTRFIRAETFSIYRMILLRCYSAVNLCESSISITRHGYRLNFIVEIFIALWHNLEKRKEEEEKFLKWIFWFCQLLSSIFVVCFANIK